MSLTRIPVTRELLAKALTDALNEQPRALRLTPGQRVTMRESARAVDVVAFAVGTRRNPDVDR